MDSQSVTSIILLIIMVVLSAFFSASETAFSSFNRIRMKNMAGAGKKGARLVLKLDDNYDKLLSTILVGNNIVNIASASVATVLFTRLFLSNGAAVSTAVMTVVVLIFGEVTPKSLAKEHAEAFALFSAPLLRGLMIILTPVNFLFTRWKKLVSKLFHAKKHEGITEEELMTIVDDAQQDGGIDEHEGELIRSAIEFNEVDTKDILTPRVDVTGVDEAATPEEIDEIFRESEFSRLPVYRETIDNIIGTIHQKDFYLKVFGKGGDVKSIIKPVAVTTQTTMVSDLLRMLQKQKLHMAVVVDEFGGTLGIVTMEDIIEELVGEIWDEHDEITEDFIKNADGSYTVLGSAALEDMFELFGIDEECDINTVSGWVMRELGKIPEEGDSFTSGNISATVTKTDSRRVQEVRLTLTGPQKPDGNYDKKDKD